MRMSPERSVFLVKDSLNNGERSIPMLPIQATIDMNSKNDVFIMHTFDLTEVEVRIQISYDHTGDKKSSIFLRNSLEFSHIKRPFPYQVIVIPKSLASGGIITLGITKRTLPLNKI